MRVRRRSIFPPLHNNINIIFNLDLDLDRLGQA